MVGSHEVFEGVIPIVVCNQDDISGTRLVHDVFLEGPINQSAHLSILGMVISKASPPFPHGVVLCKLSIRGTNIPYIAP